MNDATGMTRSASERIQAMTDADWGKLTLRLTRYAFSCVRGRSWHDAEDLAQQALADLIDPKTRSWDPSVEPDLFIHLGRHIRASLSKERKDRNRKRMECYDTVEEGGPEQGDDAPPGVLGPAGHASHGVRQDSALIAAERDDRKMKKIHERFANDKRVLEVLELLARGVLTIAEHAAYLGCSDDEAYTARRRLAKFVAKLNEEMDKEDGDDNG